MPHDEALGLAQILLLLVALTLGLPLLAAAEEPIRHVLNRRVRRFPILVLLAFTLTIVVGLVLISGVTEVRVDVEARALTAGLVVIFSVLWSRLLAKDGMTRLVHYVVKRVKAPLRHNNPIKDADLADLVILGENLGGAEKTAVILTIGEVCHDVQQGRAYGGCELDEAIDGLRRVVENSQQPASEDSLQAALSVIDECWKTLLGLGLASERDAGVLREAACSIGETAVNRRSDAEVLRCMVIIPDVVDLPYRIGAAALQQGRFRIAIGALNRLESIAVAQGRLPPGLMALSAYFCMAGRSAAEYGRALGKRLNCEDELLRNAARSAASTFAARGDFAAADAVTGVWLGNEVD
jgi:hypothetical protein